MYYILYSPNEEIICKDINQVTNHLADGWRLYGYAEDERVAISLLHECKHY